jgi:thioredoxin-dependent peroxiredoxin
MAKKSSRKLSGKKAAPKKSAKKAVKKAAKKVVKKSAPKKAAKKVLKKAVKKAAPKKATKKTAPKKAVKKAVKKVVRKVSAKKVAPKKVIAKKAAPKKVNTPIKKAIAQPIAKKVAPKAEGKFVKHKTHLKVGDAMPFFGGQDQHGNTVTSASFTGKKLVVYFYPKDDTPGCTLEACNLRDNYGMFKAQGYEILGVSKDPISSHKKFAEKFGLPFSLIADEDATIQKLFGAWGKKMFMGKIFDGTNRFTFVSDEHHKITKIIQEVDTKEHTSQIL